MTDSLENLAKKVIVYFILKIENAFDPIDLSFLFLALKKLDFGQNFINWIEN